MLIIKAMTSKIDYFKTAGQKALIFQQENREAMEFRLKKKKIVPKSADRWW